MVGNNVKNRAPKKLLAVAIIAALIAACGKSEDQAAKAPAQPTPAEAAKAPDAGAATPATVPPAPAAPALKELSVAELLKHAGSALADGRLVQPQGNNAAEYYLAVLDKDSNNAAARDGLREMFPMATGAIEQQINAGQIDEGKRAIDLMSKADPNNYALTILRSKLDLKKKQTDAEKDKRDQEKQRDQDKLLAAKATAASPATSTPVTTTAAPPPTAAPVTAAPAPAPPPPPPTTQQVPASAASAPAPGTGNTRAAKLVKRVNPIYPADAARGRQEGWVEVSFVVTAEGRVKDASIVNAVPTHVFNNAALRAVQSWTFEPRLENGNPVEQQLTMRIEFKL